MNSTHKSSPFAYTTNYAKYAKFNSREEFNNHFEQIMLLHKRKFTKAEYIAINKLRHFAFSEKSLTTIGVAWCRGQVCVSETHKEHAIYDENNKLIDTFGISRSTFDRALRVAIELGILTVYNQYANKNGRIQRVHNVYVFNRLEEVRPSEYVLQKHRKVVSMDEVKEQRTIKTCVSKKKLIPKTVRIVSDFNTIDGTKTMKIEQTITLLLELPKLKDITYPKKSVTKKLDIKPCEKDLTEYERFKLYATNFIEPAIVSKMYGAWKICYKNNGVSIKPTYELLERAFKATVYGIKAKQHSKRPILNKVGYFVRTLNNIVEKWYEEGAITAISKLEQICDANEQFEYNSSSLAYAKSQIL